MDGAAKVIVKFRAGEFGIVHYELLKTKIDTKGHLHICLPENAEKETSFEISKSGRLQCTCKTGTLNLQINKNGRLEVLT